MESWKWGLLFFLLAAVIWFTTSYEIPPAYVVFSNAPSEQYTFDTFPDNFVKYEIPDDAGGQAGVVVQDGALKMWIRTGTDACYGTESQAGVSWRFYPGKLYHIRTRSYVLPPAGHNYWPHFRVVVSPYPPDEQLSWNNVPDSTRNRKIVWGHVPILDFGRRADGGCHPSGCYIPRDIYLYISPQGGVYAWDGNGTDLTVLTSSVYPGSLQTITLLVQNDDCASADVYQDWQIDDVNVYDMDFGVFAQVNVRNLAEAGIPARVYLDGIDSRNAGAYDVNVYIDGSLVSQTTISGFPAEIPVEFSAPGDYEVNVVAVRKSDGMLSYHTIPVHVVSGRSVGYTKAFVIELNVPAELNNYTVLLRLDTNEWIQSGWVDPDLNGVRFYDKFGTLLPAWVIPETKGTSDTWIYVKVPHLTPPTDSIYVYFGNYPPYWDGYRALDAFESFEDDRFEDFTVYTSFDGSYTVSDGVLHASAGGGWGVVELKGKFVPLDQVEIVDKVRTSATGEFCGDTVYVYPLPFSYRSGPAIVSYMRDYTKVRVKFCCTVLESNDVGTDNSSWHVYVYRPFETNEMSVLYSVWPVVFAVEMNSYGAYLAHPDYFGYEWDPGVHLRGVTFGGRFPYERDYVGYRRYVWFADPTVLSLSEPTFPTETTISVSTPTAEVNEVFQATVCVTSQGSPLPDAPVQLLVSTDGESYQIYDEGTTGSDGCKVFDVSFTYPGDYYLKGRTATFGYYQGSESDYVLVHVVTSEPDENADLCTSLGYYWAGDHCCGDDPGEYTPDTCSGIFHPEGCTCSTRPPAGGGGGVALTPPPVAPPEEVPEQPEVSVQPASPLQAVSTWAWLLAVVVALYILYSFTRKR